MPGVLAHNCNPSTWDAEAGGLLTPWVIKWVQDQSELPPCLKRERVEGKVERIRERTGEGEGGGGRTQEWEKGKERKSGKRLFCRTVSKSQEGELVL